MARQLKLKAKELKYYNGEYTIPEICKLTNKTNSQVRYYLEKYSEMLGLSVAEVKKKEIPIKSTEPKRKNFTQDEIDYIAKFYGTISQMKMSKKLGRPYQSVKMKVYEMRKNGDIADGSTIETNKPRNVFGGFNVNKYMRERKNDF